MGSLPAGSGARVTASDPQNPERVYAAGLTGVFRSDDGGVTWESASQGIEPQAAQAMALDPAQPRHLYVATPTGAVYVSQDGASSWQRSAAPGAGAQ